MRTSEEQEAANVLVAIGAKHNVARFMVMDGLDCITEIQELSKVTIALYAKNSKRHMHRSNFMSTRFLLDLERAAFKMTHITHRVSHAIIIAPNGPGARLEEQAPKGNLPHPGPYN